MSGTALDQLYWTVATVNKEHPELDVQVVSAGRTVLVAVSGERGYESGRLDNLIAYVNGLADGLERFAGKRRK